MARTKKSATDTKAKANPVNEVTSISDVESLGEAPKGSLPKTSSVKKQLVQDVVDFDKDILPYHIVLLVAGVGAGKTRFLGSLAEKGKMVLEITSRRAVANEQRVDLDAIESITDIDSFKGIKKICVLTNAQVEKYMKFVYKADAYHTHFWKAFDVIALDEVHSLVTDASFSDSSFYVQEFFKIAISECKKTNFLFMTGTPEPVEYLFKNDNKDLFGDYKYNTFNRLDLFEKCKHVLPKRVQPIQKLAAIWFLRNTLIKGNKVVYFARTIENLKAIKDALVKSGIDEKTIGIDFSKSEALSSVSDSDKERRERIQKSLLDRKLPDDIQLFITTTKNKEGINIENTDIHYMFAESTMQSELKQMAGRLRASDGFECLFIVYDEIWGKPIANNLFKMLTEKSVFNSGLLLYRRYEAYSAAYSKISGLMEDRKYTGSDPAYGEMIKSRMHKAYFAPTLSTSDIEENLYMIRYSPETSRKQWYTAREKSIMLNVTDSYNLHMFFKTWSDSCWYFRKDIDSDGNESGSSSLVSTLIPDFFDGFDAFLKDPITFDQKGIPLQLLDYVPDEPDKSVPMLTGKDCLQLWFPGAEIFYPINAELDIISVFAHHFASLLEKLGIKVNADNTKSQYEDLLHGLNDILLNFDYKFLGFNKYPVDSLGPALKRVGMSIEWPNGKRLKGKLILETPINPIDDLDKKELEDYLNKALKSKDGIYSVEVEKP